MLQNVLVGVEFLTFCIFHDLETASQHSGLTQQGKWCLGFLVLLGGNAGAAQKSILFETRFFFCCSSLLIYCKSVFIVLDFLCFALFDPVCASIVQSVCVNLCKRLLFDANCYGLCMGLLKGFGEID